MKQYSLPTAAEVREAMSGLPRIALVRLDKLSGVSVHTLLKIRDGVTADPGVDTVGRIWPHLEMVRQVFLDPVEPVPPLASAAAKGRTRRVAPRKVAVS